MKHTSSSKVYGYLRFFQLKHHPFPVAPDDRNFYISRHINEIVTEIVHGILSRKGFMVLTGDIGLGKTTISRRIIRILEKQGTETALVLHTTLQQGELLKEINRDFELLPSEADDEKLGDRMHRLNQYLLDRNRQGKNCAIIIDDAQNLNHQSLELIRMISNLEADQQKLVQILLVGQPELVAKLSAPELRQLKSRIIIKKEAKPLNMRELEHYIMFKLNLAGNNGLIRLHHNALKKIRKYSSGNFRRVNILMDRALYAAFLHNTREISSRIVDDAHADLREAHPLLRADHFTIGLASALGTLFLAALFYFGVNWPFNSAASADHIVTVPIAKAMTAVPQPAATSPLPDARADTSITDVVPEKAQIVASLSDPFDDRVPAVARFLRGYGLDSYRELFVAALRTGDFESIREKIMWEAGYRLMVFETLPEGIMDRFGILVCPDDSGEKEKQLLFWKPGIDIPRFYYGYKGAEIAALQQVLARSGFYSGKMDGIVGKRLMKALVAFQHQSEIEVTGLPDPATLFLLYEGKEFTAHDRG